MNLETGQAGEEKKVIGQKDYTIDQAWLDLNPGSEFKIGDVIQVPIFEGDEQIKDSPSGVGVGDSTAGIEEVKDPSVAAAPADEGGDTSAVAAPAEEVKDTTLTGAAPAEEPQKRFLDGKLVIHDGFRELPGGSRVHHIRLEDGSEYDLSEEEYETKVKLSHAQQ